MKNTGIIIATLIALAAFPSSHAQTPPTLGLNLFAGVNITGTVGSIYSIEYNNDLAQSNAWTCLTFWQLPVTNYTWVDTNAAASPGRRFYRARLQTAPTNMVYIPPNTFKMGGDTNDPEASTNEFPQTIVTLTHGFWMGKYLVTEGVYRELVTNGACCFFATNVNLPVESISWQDATNYCALLTQRELTAGRIPRGSAFRLPTEAEWEYSARAWTSTRYFFGEDLEHTNIFNYLWTGEIAGFHTHPVGEKLPNPWGLYDMGGNLWEFCQDWIGPYLGGFQIDPQGPPSSQGFGDASYKVIRGGAYDYGANSCRSSARQIYGFGLTDTDIGFRVVLAPGQP